MAGPPQVPSSANRSRSPCWRARPPMPGGLGAGTRQNTRPARSRPQTTTGRSASSQASRITSYPQSITTMMSGSPSFQAPAAASRPATSRSCAAVTSVASSSGPSRTASSGAVHDVAAGPSAATTEYGQPAIICPALRPRPCTWQNIRSGLVRASGRSQQHTSTASRIRPSGQAGSRTHPTAHRSRPISTAPAFTASYTAPCPRRYPGTSDSPARSRTGPSPHSTASHNSNSASPRAVKHPYSSARNPRRTPGPDCGPPPGHENVADTAVSLHRWCLRNIQHEGNGRTRTAPTPKARTAPLCPEKPVSRLNGKLQYTKNSRKP
jgi:hypothetical protein